MDTQIYFGMGTGRVASMSMANALNAEQSNSCLHEGKFRAYEESGEQLLPFLTLQNRLAYEKPESAEKIIKELRKDKLNSALIGGFKYFGDIAYNNSPFVFELYNQFPGAKFIFQYRDCLTFVKSCTKTDDYDETPVGWPPEDKPVSDLERYIALGRIQPRQDTEEAKLWESWSYLSKNIWLWAETNKMILDQIKLIPASAVFYFHFESFCKDSVKVYSSLRKFLGMTDTLPDETRKTLTGRPINARKNVSSEALTVDSLSEDERIVFERYAQPIREKLGYK